MLQYSRSIFFQSATSDARGCLAMVRILDLIERHGADSPLNGNKIPDVQHVWRTMMSPHLTAPSDMRRCAVAVIAMTEGWRPM
jgi:hypothetical protein